MNYAKLSFFFFQLPRNQMHSNNMKYSFQSQD